MRPWPLLVLCSITLAPAVAGAQQTDFPDVKVRCSKSVTDRVLVNTNADLVLDDTARRLVVKCKAHPLDVAYDDVQRIVFDASTHYRTGRSGFGILSVAMASKQMTEHWCHLEYKGADGTAQSLMLRVPEESVAGLSERLKGPFGDKLELASFAEADSSIEKATLKNFDAKFDVRPDKQSHPMPESKADKALLVVVCPTLTPAGAGRGPLFKLYANDQVVAINKEGTYGFAYIDPGEYLLVSQAENAGGFRMTLEAGRDYYFMQNMFLGAMQPKTRLSRHSKELVMYEVNGSYHSDWKPK